MNTEWSELMKAIQIQLKKKDTFSQGIVALLMLRKDVIRQLLEFKNVLSKEEFSAIPFANVKGYHNKTIAYSLYHVFRIEDIVAHSLIKKDSQIFFSNHYQTRMNSPIITTGNELVKQDIADFSAKLDIDGLYQYISDVDNSTTELLGQLTFADMKIKMTAQDKETLHSLKTVSKDENAVWLIDYWCGKNIQGLLQMPLSRHWIMHTEASLRIMHKVHGS